MESVSSVAVSVGSTTAMGVEDDANNFSVVITLAYSSCMPHHCCNFTDFLSSIARAQVSWWEIMEKPTTRRKEQAVFLFV